ncbi:MAG TPA: phenylacetate--CoA ligase [Spirochaetota bacterium]|nr:phenylacetate--CoA ligase [Spirochaetota bacterium]HOM37602.1 phenylacetate--CoA ligase [Spirochaetota bacterium]HPQ49427.1 phenylacetate--CoA ligase [Spirochaetota bacterium]
MSIYYQKDIETMDPEKLRDLQSKRLCELVKYVYSRQHFYQSKFDEIGIKPSDIKSVDDIKKLPFTTKDDLRENYPFKLLAVSLSEVAEIHASSGTTGKPTVVAYTNNDLKLWGEVMARAIVCAGGRKGDIIHNGYGYGLFTGGLGVHYGALTGGFPVVPVSSGATKRQIMLIQDFKPRILTCTPSYSLHMAEEAKEMGVDPRELSLEIGIFGAEPWSQSMRKEIEKIWGLKALDIYGLSEIIGPGVAMECPGQDGLHIFADHFFPEVINPATGEHVKEGEDGELVITTLTKEALPLIRYRTRDIVSINYSVCPHCGRTLPRISKVKGRTDDMLIIRGVNVFPSQIEEVLLKIEGVEPHYVLEVDRIGSLDQLTVVVEVNETIFSDEVKEIERLETKIKREIESILNLRVNLRLVEPKTIERSMGKAKRIIDKRIN